MPGGEALVRHMLKLPRNRVFDFTQLFFLWYQHAVVSGYGMLDDFMLGMKNIKNVLARSKRVEQKNAWLDTIDTGLDATL